MSSSPTKNDNKSSYMSPRFIQKVKQKLQDYVASRKEQVQITDVSDENVADNNSINDSASSSDDENTATV